MLTNQNEPFHFVEILTYYILFFSELLISALKHELLTCRENLSHLILHHFFQRLSDRGTQRQFLENICSEDYLRSRIFGTFVVKFLACLPLLGFSNI